jgi:hypothetical protein
LLRKVRDSYDMTKNMVNKQARQLLSFNKRRVILIESEEKESTSDNVSTSEDEQDTQNHNLTFA